MARNLGRGCLAQGTETILNLARVRRRRRPALFDCRQFAGAVFT
jgi:hypothetical protein